MKKQMLKTHVKPLSVVIILWGLALIILLNLLARFNIIDWTPLQSNITTLICAVFLLSEVSFFAMIRKFKKGEFNVVDIVISIVGLIAIFGAIISLAGISIAILESGQSIAEAALFIFVLIEIFRKN